jgi:hypothetical protein
MVYHTAPTAVQTLLHPEQWSLQSRFHHHMTHMNDLHHVAHLKPARKK